MSEATTLPRIVSVLERTLPADWATVVFYAEYYEKAFSIEYFVKTWQQADFVKCFSIPGIKRSALLDDFIEIDKVISPERESLDPSKRWDTMTLVLQANGKIRVDYGYDDLVESPYLKKQELKRIYLGASS